MQRRMDTPRLIRPVRLWPSLPNGARRVTWLELFFDLVFVAAVSQVGVPLGHDYSIHGLARYAFMFLLIWWAWLGHTLYCTRFDNDDIVQRALTLLQMFAVVVMAANAKQGLESRDSAGFGAAYAVMRLVLVGQYLRARHLRHASRLATVHAAGFGVAAILWVAAALVPTPTRLTLWALALLVDLITPWLADYTQKIPPDAAHLPERFGLFTIILLGESVAALMRGVESQEAWPLSALASAVLGLCLTFLCWWWYFEGAQGAAERHIRSVRHARAFHVWTYVHLPLYLSIAVVGLGIEHVISLPPGIRLHVGEAWILTAGMAVLMASLTTIRLTAETGRRTWSQTHQPFDYVPVAAALMGGFAGTVVAPYLLLSYFALLCAAQVMIASRHYTDGAVPCEDDVEFRPSNSGTRPQEVQL